MTQEEKNKKVLVAGAIGSSVGLGAGLYYAFSGKKGFWSYVGYGLLGSILGGIATRVPAYIILKADKPVVPVTEPDKEVDKEDVSVTENVAKPPLDANNVTNQIT